LIQLSSDSESAARPLFLAIIASMSRKISMAIITYYVNILTERSTSSPPSQNQNIRQRKLGNHAPQSLAAQGIEKLQQLTV
jgi:hypothetical protein